MTERLKDRVEIKGELIGVDFSKRIEGIDPHVLMNIYTGDDGMWCEALMLDSAWIDDFISVLTRVKEHMDENFEKLEDGYGYVYKGDE